MYKRQLQAGGRQQVVQRGQLLVEGEVEPRDVGGDDDIGQLATGEGSVELLRDLFVVCLLYTSSGVPCVPEQG